MTYRLILFDLDDTLLDFGRTQAAAFDATMARFGVDGRGGELYRRYQGFTRDCWRRYEQGALAKELLRTERFRLTLEWAGVPCRSEAPPPAGPERSGAGAAGAVDGPVPVDDLSESYLEELPRHPFLIDHAVDVCRRVARSATVGVVTNGFERVQRARMAVAPFRDDVAFLLTSEAVGAPKPERAIFDRALALGDARPEETLMIGDNPSSDIAGARALGIDSVWYAPDAAADDQGVVPTHRIRCLTELLDLPRMAARVGVMLLALGALGGAQAQDHPAAGPDPATTGQDPAGDAATDDAPRDALGDLLPEGALARLGSLRLRLPDHVVALAFDDEAGTITGRGPRGTGTTWSVADGAPLRHEPGDDRPFAALAATPALELRVSPAGDAALTWSLMDGRVALHRSGPDPDVRPVELGGRFVADAAFDGSGERVAVIGERITGRDDFGTWVLCLDLRTAEPVWEQEVTGMAPSRVAFAPGELLVAGRDGRVARLAPSDGADRGLWRAHDASIGALCGAAGGLAVTGSDGGEVALWQLGEAGAEPTAPWFRAGVHLVSVSAVALSPDLGLVASGGRDHRVHLSSLGSGDPVAEPETHATRLTGLLAADPSGLTVTAAWSGGLGLWRRAEREPTWIGAHAGRITGLARVGGGLLLTSGQDGTLALWDPATGAAAGPRIALDAAVVALTCAGEGAHIAASLGDGRLALFSLARDAEERPTLRPQGSMSSGSRFAFSLAYMPGGDGLAVGTTSVQLVDAATGGTRWQADLRASVMALAVTPDGSQVIAGLASRTVVGLDGATGDELWRWADHPGRIQQLAVAPDGSWLAACGGDGSVRLRALSGAGEPRILAAHDEEATCLAWGADGVLLSGSADGTALVWRP